MYLLYVFSLLQCVHGVSLPTNTHLEKEDKFCYTIKKARLFIEHEYESLLSYGNVAGAIFALKNFGWIDKQDINMTGDINIDPKEFVK